MCERFDGPVPQLYAGMPTPFRGEYHIGNPPDHLQEGIWLAIATGSHYVHVNCNGEVDNSYRNYYDPNTPGHWNFPETGPGTFRFEKGDLVRYKKEYNNYGDCQATQRIREVVEYIGDPHPGYECWDGHPDPHWYILEPPGHHWCDPEHGLELIHRKNPRSPMLQKNEER